MHRGERKLGGLLSWADGGLSAIIPPAKGIIKLKEDEPWDTSNCEKIPKKPYDLHVSLFPKMHRGKKKWLVRNMSGDQQTHRLFDSYKEAFETCQHFQHHSLDNMLPEHL